MIGLLLALNLSIFFLILRFTSLEKSIVKIALLLAVKLTVKLLILVRFKKAVSKSTYDVINVLIKSSLVALCKSVIKWALIPAIRTSLKVFMALTLKTLVKQATKSRMKEFLATTFAAETAKGRLAKLCAKLAFQLAVKIVVKTIVLLILIEIFACGNNTCPSIDALLLKVSVLLTMKITIKSLSLPAIKIYAKQLAKRQDEAAMAKKYDDHGADAALNASSSPSAYPSSAAAATTPSRAYIKFCVKTMAFFVIKVVIKVIKYPLLDLIA